MVSTRPHHHSLQERQHLPSRDFPKTSTTRNAIATEVLRPLLAGMHHASSICERMIVDTSRPPHVGLVDLLQPRHS